MEVSDQPHTMATLLQMPPTQKKKKNHSAHSTGGSKIKFYDVRAVQQ
jgi:hypothetical protein